MTNLHRVDWDRVPRPEDDGAADHLVGTSLPAIPLPSTNGGEVDLSALRGQTVVYAYPMTGRPGRPLPPGWDEIPGARGCTPQACAFRDHAADLKAHGVTHLFGLSTQSTPDQQEAVDRLHLPFPLLSDAELKLVEALALPTMDVGGSTFLKRLTLIIQDGVIAHVFYPVFPPDVSPSQVIDWLRSRPARNK